MDIYLHTSILSHITSKAQKNLNFLEKGAIMQVVFRYSTN